MTVMLVNHLTYQVDNYECPSTPCRLLTYPSKFSTENFQAFFTVSKLKGLRGFGGISNLSAYFLLYEKEFA
jgi:hypothetical protein